MVTASQILASIMDELKELTGSRVIKCGTEEERNFLKCRAEDSIRKLLDAHQVYPGLKPTITVHWDQFDEDNLRIQLDPVTTRVLSDLRIL